MICLSVLVYWWHYSPYFPLPSSVLVILPFRYCLLAILPLSDIAVIRQLINTLQNSSRGKRLNYSYIWIKAYGLFLDPLLLHLHLNMRHLCNKNCISKSHKFQFCRFTDVQPTMLECAHFSCIIHWRAQNEAVCLKNMFGWDFVAQSDTEFAFTLGTLRLKSHLGS